MSYGKIYKITNKVNGMEYVGQTTGSISSRFITHCREKRNNRHISNAIRHYGKDNFSIVELAIADNLNTLNELEVYYLNLFNTMSPNGYNHRAGGNQNGKCSDELKSKISKAKTGKSLLKRRGEIRSTEQRIKISRSLGGHPIKMTNLMTGELTILQTAHDGTKYGLNPSNIVQICKKSSGRISSKGFSFEYIKNANQNGSSEINNSEHVQRIEGEPANAEYNPSTSPQPLFI